MKDAENSGQRKKTAAGLAEDYNARENQAGTLAPALVACSSNRGDHGGCILAGDSWPVPKLGRRSEFPE
jgi:hypothetical protein